MSDDDVKKHPGQIRRDYYNEMTKEALLREHYPESFYDTHMNVLLDGRERGLWFGIQDNKDIEEGEISVFPGRAMLLSWDQVANLYHVLSGQLEKDAGR